MNKVKLSHSAINRYLTCGKSYELQYVKRWTSKYKSGALFFGSALDAALNEVLNDFPIVGLEKYMDIFEKNWLVGQDSSYQAIDLPENVTITYAASDFDADLLKSDDWAKLYKKAEALGSDNPIKLFNEIKDEKGNVGWKNISDDRRVYYNYTNWLSLRRKGFHMLQAYYDVMLPTIKTVISTQKKVTLLNADGDEVPGFVDAILELKDGRVAVIDNKTSSIEYDADSVKTSPQLTLYKTLLEEEGMKIDAAGYFVLRKGLKKDIEKVCKSCGFKAEKGSTHKTCYNEIEKKRCGGAWDRSVEFRVDTQIIIDNIPEAMQDMVIENINTVNHAIKNNIYPRNLNSCKMPWGKCDFYEFCHFGKKDDLVIKGDSNG